MKKFLVILLVLVILLLVAMYSVYTYRSGIIAAQKLNNEYKEYEGIQVLGTELISIINKTIDVNNRNEIPRDDNNYYIDNEENTIKIHIQFVYKDEVKTLEMEDIEKSGTEAFIQMYSTASFKCTNIEYHEKTKNVKSLTFEEIPESLTID